jgi:S-adenosylmethionine-diacylglycerol 3-amino-3-carboxypropyl transferase
VSNLVRSETLEEQLEWWNKGNLALLPVVVSDFFNKTPLSLHGRDSIQMKFVKEENLGPVVLQRFLNLLKGQLVSTNPYMYYFLTGEPLLSDAAIPLFRASDYLNIRARLDCVELITGDLESYLGSTAQRFDFMNLSDIFEYLDDAHCEALFKSIAKHLQPKGAVAYWNLFVDRLPRHSLRINQALSQAISREDQTWFYSNFLVAEPSE